MRRLGRAAPRRVIANAKWTDGKANPRFLTPSLHWSDGDVRKLYEDVYCARGEMETRITKCQSELFASRTSAASLRANQLRPCFAAFASVLIAALRRLDLCGTVLAKATCGTIRLTLLKTDALITKILRRVTIAFVFACPLQREFANAHTRLCRASR